MAMSDEPPARRGVDPDDGLDERVTAEERAAGAEAGAVGGSAGDEEVDPAARPVEEAGGGVAEGFELSEEELQDHAGHAADEREPTADAFTPEVESDRSQAAYGEPDELEPSEPDARGE